MEMTQRPSPRPAVRLVLGYRVVGFRSGTRRHASRIVKVAIDKGPCTVWLAAVSPVWGLGLLFCRSTSCRL